MNAVEKIRTDHLRHLNESMSYFKNIQQEIEMRPILKQKKERAQSANTYQSIRY